MGCKGKDSLVQALWIAYSWEVLSIFSCIFFTCLLYLTTVKQCHGLDAQRERDFFSSSSLNMSSHSVMVDNMET